MKKITLSAAAKLNLTLDITGRRADGYHLMEMLMHSVDLCDTVVLEKTPTPGVTLRADGDVPTDERNTAVKAAKVFFGAVPCEEGVVITIEKRIPMQAGMAGGSADAAAVLVGLNLLFEGELTAQQLQTLGLTVGADVPYCIVGGMAVVTGIGEKVTPYSAMPNGHFAIVKPREGVSTVEAFARFDAVTPQKRPDTERALQMAVQGKLEAMPQFMGNVLEEAVTLTALDRIKEALAANGAICAQMTGSGSAVFGIFADEETAQKAAKALSETWSTWVAKPTKTGVTVLMTEE